MSSKYERLNTRKASIVDVGGFRPTGDPLSTHFGLRPLGAPGEVWPTSGRTFLLFVCQLNLTAAPVVPPLLSDIQVITFFADLDASLGKENGEGWHLSAYPSIGELTPMTRPTDAAALRRGFECRWEACDDHPNYDDPDRVGDSDEELDHVARTKIGGYLSTIQSEPWWSLEDHPSAPAYCLQINSEEKVGLAWGHAGTIYLARGTAEGCSGQWFLDWQCH